MTMDPRTLGFFRLVVGFLVTADCIRHWKEARWFYSNEGVLTNHYHLFRPSSGFNFSLFHAFSSLEEVHVAFALATFCHFCFFIGWYTRLFSVLSFLFVTSLDNRFVMVENGGYVVENLLLGWAMFMPTGQRFSVDALLRSFRERKERSAAELNTRAPFAWADKPHVSLIGLVTTLNIAVIYYFNVVNKSGIIWRKGDTVHYVLHLDRMITGLAVPFREHMPLWMMRPVAWSVLVVEALLVPLILAPAGRRITRPLAMLLMTGLHGSFGVMMRLGPFSWFMIAWSFLFPQPVHWELLGRWYTKKARRWVVVYDRRSPLAFFLCRLFARLDLCERLSFEESPEDEAAPPLLRVRDPETNELQDDHEALAALARSLPAGRFLWPLARVSTLGLSAPLFGYVARRRDATARAFGLTLPPRGQGEEASGTPSPLAERASRVRAGLREALVAWFFVCAVSQTINENKSVPAFLKHPQPWLMQATLGYPRMYQGWGMFAPNPISDDGSITIDAWTIGGRHVDPFTGEEPDLNLSDARGLGLNQIWQDYFNRIRLDRNKVFRHGLKEYLLRWHEETGRPEDELVAFDVYWLRDQCPLPGQTQPYKHEKIAILTYRKPGYRPPPGYRPLPPEPKVESAGN
ncbi:hypothetical protein GF068_23105 [Polyangium spumosum]|uniref:HTTM-like domain-containing protein n=2 Tax=Polyangium spumosum TaxID=889282 RepID=A0A6N7PVD8_9BACT|nr:hypothetical protein [Polyangium spumosum]